jgi:excisionase family DNA binding protein
MRGAATEIARGALYVALTRGRDGNTIYVATDAIDPDRDRIPDPAERTPYDILQRIVVTSGAETSTTERHPGYAVIKVDIDDFMHQRKTILASGIEPDALRDHAQVSDALFTSRQSPRPWNSPHRQQEHQTMKRNEPKTTLTVEEAAKLLGISRGLAFQAVRRGDIPSIRIGRRILIPRARLRALLDGDNAQGAVPEQRGNGPTSR